MYNFTERIYTPTTNCLLFSLTTALEKWGMDTKWAPEFKLMFTGLIFRNDFAHIPAHLWKMYNFTEKIYTPTTNCLLFSLTIALEK